MIYHIYSVQKKHNEKEAFFQWFDNYLNQLLGFHYSSGQLLILKSAGGWGTGIGNGEGRTFFSQYIFCISLSMQI